MPPQWVFHGVLISGSGHRALRQALKYLGGSIYLKGFFFHLAPNRNGMFWKGTILILGS